MEREIRNSKFLNMTFLTAICREIDQKLVVSNKNMIENTIKELRAENEVPRSQLKELTELLEVIVSCFNNNNKKKVPRHVFQNFLIHKKSVKT